MNGAEYGNLSSSTRGVRNQRVSCLCDNDPLSDLFRRIGLGRLSEVTQGNGRLQMVCTNVIDNYIYSFV